MDFVDWRKSAEARKVGERGRQKTTWSLPMHLPLLRVEELVQQFRDSCPLFDV